MTKQLIFELDEIPPAPIRGNKRGHWSMSEPDRKDWIDKAILASRDARLEGVLLDKPCKLEIYVTCPKGVDWDNIIHGLKPFFDGLQPQKDKRTGVVFIEGVLQDDALIDEVYFVRRIGKPHTRIVITEKE